MALFEADVAIACPPQAAFDFLIRPAQVLRTSPPNLAAKLIEASRCAGTGQHG